MRCDRELALVIPGLFGLGADAQALPRLPALETLLARADRHPSPESLEGLLFSLFGAERAAGADWPVASVCRVGEGAAPDGRFWFRADPVHLSAARDRVYLAAVERLDLAEAAALAGEVAALYRDDGWQIETPHPLRWYLGFERPAAVTTTPLGAALGGDLESHWPKGEEALRWRGLLNELQMLLHQSGVNAAREARGDVPVNGLWLWGGGTLPELDRGAWSAVFSDDCLALGLGRLSGAAVAGLPVDFQKVLASETPRSLVVDTHLLDARAAADIERFAAHLAELEQRWFSALLPALRSGRLTTLHLYPGHGARLTLTRALSRRWWRRRRSLGRY